MYPIAHEGRLFTPDGPAGPSPAQDSFTCAFCSQTKPVFTGSSRMFPEYGILRDRDGNEVRMCYACCGSMERDRMHETGRAVLYLIDREVHPAERWYWGYTVRKGRRVGYSAQNFPGTLTIPIYQYHARKVFSPIGGYIDRVDVWFKDDRGREWWGVNRGDNQLIRCKRLKSKKG